MRWRISSGAGGASEWARDRESVLDLSGGVSGQDRPVAEFGHIGN